MLAVEYALPVVVWLGRGKFEEFSAQRARREKQLSDTVWVCVRGVLQRTTGAFLPSKKRKRKKKEKKCSSIHSTHERRQTHGLRGMDEEKNTGTSTIMSWWG